MYLQDVLKVIFQAALSSFEISWQLFSLKMFNKSGMPCSFPWRKLQRNLSLTFLAFGPFLMRRFHAYQAIANTKVLLRTVLFLFSSFI